MISDQINIAKKLIKKIRSDLDQINNALSLTYVPIFQFPEAKKQSKCDFMLTLCARVLQKFLVIFLYPLTIRGLYSIS